ncbi:MAG TPA: FecR domain-containing protein [Pyrinomonadaceae bacterium]|nr:FecR domain-containing protein [Pyrinomonadaceae bacterium]
MFGQQHVRKQLTAYAHGELAAAESARVAAHLGACARCRAEFEKIAHGIRLLENLSPQAAPVNMWESIEAALAEASLESFQSGQAERPSQGDAREADTRRAGLPGNLRPGDLLSGVLRSIGLRPVRLMGWRPALAAGLILLFVLGAGGASWFYLRETGASWEVARLAGAPSIDAGRIGQTGRLRIGEWLETDAGSRAQIKVADIGQVEIDPGTRIRLVETRETEHRLELARGRMHANIYAPPRLFFVDTPSAVAADLGCAYTLEVDDEGSSVLHVTAGWVAFETKDRESMVPAGAACRTQPGVGPGTPYFEDASKLFLDSLAKFDFAGGGREALRLVVAEARARDTLTLWHLLARVAGEERAGVYERLAALAPPPAGVTRDGVLLLDPAMLSAWKAQMEALWLA